MFTLLLIAFVFSPRVRRNKIARILLIGDAAWALVMMGVPVTLLLLAGVGYLAYRAHKQYEVERQAARRSAAAIKRDQRLAA